MYFHFSHVSDSLNGTYKGFILTDRSHLQKKPGISVRAHSRDADHKVLHVRYTP